MRSAILVCLLWMGLAAQGWGATTHYYVSSEATNGYALGNDANSGLTRALPKLTLDAVPTALGDDVTIHLNGTEINCNDTKELASRVNCTISGEFTKTRIVNRATVAGNYGLTIPNLAIVTLENVKLGVGLCAVTPLRIGSTASVASLTMNNVTLEASATTYCMTTGSPVIVNLTMNGCQVLVNSAAAMNTCLPIAVTTGSTVLVNGLDLDVTAASIPSPVISISNAVGGTPAVTIRGVTGKITSTQTSGTIIGIEVVEIDGAITENCLFQINNNNGGTEGAYGISYRSATNQLATGFIRNNTVILNAQDGIIICVGSDSTANKVDGVSVYGNRVMGPLNVAGLHGILIGNNDSCVVYNNRVALAFIGIIVKQSTGNFVHHNVVEKVPDGGQAYRMKGAVDSIFAGNLYLAGGIYTGYGLFADDGTINTSGCILAGNSVYITDNTSNMRSLVYKKDVNQGIVAYGNNYYAKDGGSFFFNAEGVAKNLATWNALAYASGETSFQFNPTPNLRKLNSNLLLLK